MLRLRPYKLRDSEYILRWMGDEYAFAQWCANKFTYPLTKEQLNNYYHDYEKDENAWSMTALNDEGIPIGHIHMRRADYKNDSIHFGFIIVDSQQRGRGYGKEMVSLAIKYTFDILNLNRITLAVFDNNPTAHHCYRSIGFTDQKYHEAIFPVGGERWGVYDMEMIKFNP